MGFKQKRPHYVQSFQLRPLRCKQNKSKSLSDNFREQEKKNIEKASFSLEKISHISNPILAAASIITLVIIYYMSSEQNKISLKNLQFAITSDSINENSTKEALRISDSSLTIASKSLDFTDSTLKAYQIFNKIAMRAYLGIGDVVLVRNTVGEYLQVAIVIKNTGKTPAYNLKVISSFKFGKENVYQSDFASIMTRNGSTSSNYSLGSEMVLVHNMMTEVVTEESKSEFDKGKAVFVFGRISYDDTFGGKHLTEFCFHYDGEVTKQFQLFGAEHNFEN